MEAGKSKICRVGCQAGRPMLQLQSEGQKPGEFFLAASLFVLFRSLTDCMRPTQIMEANLLYSGPTGLNANHIQKHSHRNPK